MDVVTWISLGKFVGGLIASTLIMLLFCWLFDQIERNLK
jgi:hypothetical protein